MKFLKKIRKKEEKDTSHSREAAKERLHLVLLQDRANVSADFLELMKQEIIEVIKKYIDIDENAIDVRLTNKENDDGTNGAPALYANIPIVNIKNKENVQEDSKESDNKEDKGEESDNKEDKREESDNKEDKSEESDNKEDKSEESDNKEDNKEEMETQEDTEPIKEIENERIAKVIIEGGMYKKEEKPKLEKE